MKDFRGPPPKPKAKQQPQPTQPKGKPGAPPDKSEPKPGELPENRIPIFDHKGNMRGHVGKTATGATVARFLGRHGADLTTKDGRDAWVGHKPPPPPPPPTIIMGDGSAPPPGVDPKQAKGSAKPTKNPAAAEGAKSKVK